MAHRKKTTKQAMKYWQVGWNGVVIKARTARVAVRKWLRDNAATYWLIRDHELDNSFGSGDMPHETASHKPWAKYAKDTVGHFDIKDIPVREVVKNTHGPHSPEDGKFWRGFNK